MPISKQTTKTKAAILSVAALGFVGASFAPLVTNQASADQNRGGSNSQGWGHGWNRSSGADAALVVEAVESYMASKPTPTPPAPTEDEPTPDPEVPVNPETMRVTKLMVWGDNAFGVIKDGETTSYFFAHKDNEVWQVVHEGTSTPPESTVKQFSLPKEWTKKDPASI